MSFDGETNLAARGDDDRRRFPAGRIGEHIGTTRDAGSGRVFAPVQGRQRLARQGQQRRLVAQLHDVAIGFDDFVCIARSQSDQVWNCPHGRQMFYRLMRRAIFAITHCVVGEDKEGR